MMVYNKCWDNNWSINSELVEERMSLLIPEGIKLGDKFVYVVADGLHDVQSGSWVVQNGIDQDFEVRESERPSVCAVKDCQSGVDDRLQAL